MVRFRDEFALAEQGRVDAVVDPLQPLERRRAGVARLDVGGDAVDPVRGEPAQVVVEEHRFRRAFTCHGRT
ncbi:MAG: hypothetical protein U0800_08445 [Isosphaeraceae bacterium]